MNTTIKITMGIDQSFTCTAVVIVDEDKNIIHHQIIESSRTSGAAIAQQLRALSIACQVTAIAQQYRPDQINIEGLSFGSKSLATRDLAGLQYVITTQLAQAGFINIDVIAPTTLKKAFSGSGRASKDDMFDACDDDVKAVAMKYKRSRGRFDFVDAYALATYNQLV